MGKITTLTLMNVLKTMRNLRVFMAATLNEMYKTEKLPDHHRVFRHLLPFQDTQFLNTYFKILS